MDPVIQGTPTTIVYGAGQVFLWNGGLSEGRTVSAELDPQSNMIPLPDVNNIPTGQIVVPQMIKGQAVVEMQSDLTPPTVADTDVTLGGVTVFLTKPPKKNWERGGLARWTFELSAFPADGVAGWPA